VRVQAVLKASPISSTLWYSEHSFVGFDGGEGGFEEPYSIAARYWEKMQDPSALFKRLLSYSRQ